MFIFVNILLYWALGIVTATAGITIRHWQFYVILALFVAVDILNYVRGLKVNQKD